MNRKTTAAVHKQLRSIAMMNALPRAFFAAPDHSDANPEKTHQRLLAMTGKKDLGLVDGGVASFGAKSVKDYFPPSDLGFERNDSSLHLEMKADDGLFHEFEESYAFKEREEQKIVLKTQDLDFQKMIAEAPKYTGHDGRRGPLDVELTEDQKHPHVADRLGHPEYLYNNVDKLLMQEPDLAHPGFTNQPFVQKPGANPDEKLTFESGDVVYENLQLKEWLKFWRASYYSFVLFWYQTEKEGYLTNIPVREDNFWWQEEWNIWMTHNNIDFDMKDSGNFYDVLDPYIMVNLMAAIYTVFQVPKYFLNDYAVRMRYSADKQLLFVTRQNTFLSEEETVYEMENLEFLPPTLNSALPYMSALDTKDGIMTVRCLTSKDTFNIYLNDKFWDLDHKADFVKGVTNLWRDIAANGRNINQRGEEYFKP